MKFSYTLLQKLAPAIKSPEQLVDLLIAHLFEVDGVNKDTIDINISANRYSDAASHYGIAMAVSAVLNKKVPALKLSPVKPKPASIKFSVKIESKKLCPRYSGLYVEVKKISASPQWLQDALIACGLRPINNVVDVMNYVMLEVGQPLHVFDYDKIEGDKFKNIFVRNARNGEVMKGIDGSEYKLSAADLVISDDKSALAIAGIKGGKKAEISENTRCLIIEAANFDAATIYKTSHALNLITDASQRFGHGLSPALVELAIKRVAALLKEVCGAQIGDWVDISNIRYQKAKIIKFDVARFNRLTGLNLGQAACFAYLKNLGFTVKGQMVSSPPARMDISLFEDLVEEIVNLYGYNKLPVVAPRVHLAPSGLEDQIMLKDKIRKVLTGLGINETYNYSFVTRKEALEAEKVWDNKPIALRNPISSEFQYLRPSLEPHLARNIEDNKRFYDEVRLFEIGKVFPEEGKEILSLGIILESKNPDIFLELKGVLDSLLKSVGLVDFEMIPHLDGLRVESGHQVIGFLRPANNYAELDLDKMVKLVSEEHEYRLLPKYPSVMRDLSIIVGSEVRVGEAQDLIENASHLLEDVDLLDWYEDSKLGPDRKSLTFRLVFHSEERTLTDEEVGQEMERIVAEVREKFDAELR